ncbi:MAG: hypothetical protein QXS37_06585, partial [Candidatus Aenigmatarchaeota archaeon]
NCILYLLGLIKLNFKHWTWEKLVENCKKYIKEQTRTREILENLINDDLPWDDYKTGKIKWIDIKSETVIRYLGYWCLFNVALKSLIKYIKNKKYKEPYFRCIEPYEGVAEYIILDIKS